MGIIDLYISSEEQDIVLEKAFNREGLVKKKVSIRGPKGVHQGYRWVKEGSDSGGSAPSKEDLSGSKATAIRKLIAHGVTDAKSIKEITGASSVQIYKEFAKTEGYTKGASKSGGKSAEMAKEKAAPKAASRKKAAPKKAEPEGRPLSYTIEGEVLRDAKGDPVYLEDYPMHELGPSKEEYENKSPAEKRARVDLVMALYSRRQGVSDKERKEEGEEKRGASYKKSREKAALAAAEAKKERDSARAAANEKAANEKAAKEKKVAKGKAAQVKAIQQNEKSVSTPPAVRSKVKIEAFGRGDFGSMYDWEEKVRLSAVDIGAFRNAIRAAVPKLRTFQDIKDLVRPQDSWENFSQEVLTQMADQTRSGSENIDGKRLVGYVVDELLKLNPRDTRESLSAPRPRKAEDMVTFAKACLRESKDWRSEMEGSSRRALYAYDNNRNYKQKTEDEFFPNARQSEYARVRGEVMRTLFSQIVT